MPRLVPVRKTVRCIRTRYGLEGITVNTRNDHVVVLNERQPGLLIELDYDWAGDTVLQRLDLTISTGDKPKRIRKPEGVAVDPGRKRMYVVSDRDADLYVFQLHDDC